ncbi:hypothetical protein AKJ57_04110 [candidate division MSBL1 archaeon SCGC-AAA259A05]|uniref:Alanine--tRNA ligase n=1 Tax=candidate division MSBL1 archaeon SCGC-AAA259A05 TaxID=1698259 RepID=A0A133U8H3_9EURY|nr:hypothetical protein AKJ57_04110 [candidate division MSBL1 archaeon SCGC-AAA259A05]
MNDIYEVGLFEREDFQRKKCSCCGRIFWTLDPERKTCGDTPCDEYTFIGDPPIGNEYTLPEMEEEFLNFFEKQDHSRVSRCPVVARWRDDIYLTIASIADFQPWVTSGEAPPPANPLVVSQPSIRLNDVDNVGRSGRHFTLFFMGGHHAFNTKNEQIYWNDLTVDLCHEFMTDALGIDREEITYVQDFWKGGGNAGEDFEVNVRGLELSTLVFMQYGIEDDNRYELPLKIVDTGYGIERLVWASQGTPTSYEAVFGPLIEKIRRLADVSLPSEEILEKHSKLAGLMDIETGRDLNMLRSKVSDSTGIEVSELDRLMVPLESVYAIADHLRCLAFMFADGITPSNEGGGYLSRLVLRRTLRLMRDLDIEGALLDLMDFELKELSSDHPRMAEKRDHILEVMDSEGDKYRETLEQGKRLVSRLSSSLKKKGKSEIGTDNLIELYDSHGLPPEIVNEIAEEDMKVEVPEDFYIQVAESHSHPEEEAEEASKIPEEFNLEDLPETELLYYENPYQKEFEAEVLQRRGDYVVLDRTVFFPEGGGQPADKGNLKGKTREYDVTDVQKENGVILHRIKPNTLRAGQKVKGEINWERRGAFMRHHTATHVLLGALRRLLGDHVWQHGVQKGKKSSRLDVSHFERISDEQLRKVEKLANRIVLQNRKVNTFWMDRNEAEGKYGHDLYQGGVVPGKEIRIVDIEDWNAQACAGTHCTRTGEVGLIKIIGRERIQDGVERLVFASGEPVLEVIQEREEKLKKSAEILRTDPEKIDTAVRKLFDQWKSARKEIDSLKLRLGELRASELESEAEKIDDLKIVAEELEGGDNEELIEIGKDITKDNEEMIVILGTGNGSSSIVVMAGEKAIERGIDCGDIASEAAGVLGGGGGGKPSLGQGGGNEVDKLEKSIKVATKVCKKQMGEN